MKKRLFWVVIPAVVFTFGACKKSGETARPGPSTPPATTSPTESHPTSPTSPAPSVAGENMALSAEERAVKLGFVRYLPQDTESVISIYNGSKISARTKGMKLWKVIEKQLGGGLMGMGPQMMPGEEMDQEMKPADEDFAIPEGEQEKTKKTAAAEKPAAAPFEAPDAGDDSDAVTTSDDDLPARSIAAGDMLGLEVTVAVGKSAGEQLGNLVTLGTRLNYFQMRALAKAYALAVKAGDLSTLSSAMGKNFSEELAKNMINDTEGGLALLERSNMPPTYVAFRSSKDKQAAVAAAVADTLGNIGQAGEMVETVDFEQAGGKFSGFKLLGSKISAQMANGREEMDTALGAETASKLLAAIAKKNLVIASATLGEYVVVFIGATEADCHLVSESAKSLTSGSALAFSDAYAAKDLAALIVGNDSATHAIHQIQGGLASYTNGLRDGLASEDGAGDTRDLQAMLQLVTEREAALRKLGGMEALGMVAFFEHGLKVECFGGQDAGAIDWKTPAKLSHLGDAADVAIFVNWSSDAAYDVKARAYGEALVETAYAMAMKVSELPLEGGQMKQFKGMATLFNDKFRSDAVTLWDAVKGEMNDGLGQERAFIVDLKGSVPTLPGVPKLLVDKGRFPRATMIYPVSDRAKLASSWAKMSAACTKLLAKVSTVAGQEIPMQKPLSSDKNGYTTWFISMPFFNDDFVPSVTVGDKWFAASTSKTRALELLADAEHGQPGRYGMYLKMDFKAMQECGAETMQLLDENAQAVFGEGSPQLAKFTASKTTRAQWLDAIAELDSLTIHSRREGTVLRGSVHFKTR